MADEEAQESDPGLLEQVSEGAAQAWETASETVDQAVETVTESAEQAWGTVTETAEQAWDATAEAAEQAWNTVTDTATEVWHDVADGNPVVPGAAVVDQRVIGPPSLFDLQRLAGNVPEAKAQWATLGEGERAALLDVIASFWGADFAQAFATTPADLGIDNDSIRNLSHDDVAARGFPFLP